MSDFNYEVETINHYYFENLTIDGRVVQNGTPTPDNPAPIEVVEPVNGVFGISVNGVVTPIDLQGNVLASLPDGTKDALTVDSTGAVTLEKRIQKIIVNGSSPNAYFSRISKDGDIYQGTVNIPNFGTSGTNYSALSDRFVQTTSYTQEGMLIRGTFINIQTKSLFTTVNEANAWASSNPINIYYKLATPQTIDLGTIDVSNLQDMPEETPILIVSAIEPVTDYSYRNVPTYQVSNPYEDYNAPEYAYPPNHIGQEWETFDANDWDESEMLDYTGQMESHAVYTVELCELMQSGAFDWKRPELNWSEAAYDQEQFERFCKYFEQRFMFREISMLPPLQWFTAFKRMMVYELMPKYKPLYAQVENGISPLGENEYYKERHISSLYPETMLSGNSDYISSGEDREFERIKIDNAAEALEAYRNGYRSVDAALGDELEVLFISMYTSYVNGL